MKEGNVILDKSFAFAIRIVELHKYLVKEKKEYELSKQIIRSGTSIGSNIEEVVCGVSKKDFVNKLGISYKEARETRYWLKLLYATAFIDHKTFNSMLNDCEELIRILTAILNSSKENDKNNS